MAIKTFRYKSLQAFFLTGSKKGIQLAHAAKRSRQLTALDEARKADEMALPGWGLHSLSGGWAGHFAVSVSGNWRLVFTFEGSDAVLLDYMDYH
jgi:toxin HigB-1